MLQYLETLLYLQYHGWFCYHRNYIVHSKLYTEQNSINVVVHEDMDKHLKHVKLYDTTA